MKNIKKYAYAAAGVIAVSAAMQSCSIEEPFGNREGVLHMRLDINSDVTRAAMDEQELADNCVVYISGQKGLVFKEKGLSNLPDAITLRQGNYVAEAWTGDSVPASFDSKFYRCYQPFVLESGVNDLQLTCKIVNVVTSVDYKKIDDTQVRNVHVTVASSNASLEFTPENYKTAKGYFMMPFDENGVRESELKFTVTGENILGEPFTKEIVRKNVQPAYEYVVNINCTPDQEEPQGGGFITISIDERENVVAETVAIFAAPVIEGVDFDIEKQIVGEQGQFSGDKVVKVVAFNEIESFTIECVDMANLNLPATAIDLKKCDDQTVAQLHAAGIYWDKTVEDVAGYDGITRQLSYITFSEQYLNSLPERASEYRIVLTATDGTGHDGLAGKSTVRTIRIAVGEDAIVYDDPLIVEDAVNPNNLMTIGARSVTLTASIKDDTATGLGIQYREAGTTDWTKVPVNKSRATAVSVKLTNLKPGTRYEYKAYADGFEASESKFFTTEAIFELPNASMEDWSNFADNNKVLLPDAGGQRTFWDSGNHGSTTMNVTLTQGSEDMLHSGAKSAKLRSQFVGVGALGKFAAGNLFAGTYLRTDGTDGVIEFGRPYNGTHPSKLRVYVNYRPGTVEKGGDKITKGSKDEGQIYVALTTAPIEVRTKTSSQKLFPTSPADEDYDKLVAYGQYTFEGNYGPDGALQSLEIPLDYFPKANTIKPSHLVIVCSASKYGDFFQGGEGSTMYLDDFELIYE